MLRFLVVLLWLPSTAWAQPSGSRVMAGAPGAASREASSTDSSGPRVRIRPGAGARISTVDDRFALSIGARVQVRAEASASEAGASLDGGVRRARINLGGHFFGSENRFRVQLALSPADLGMLDTGAVTRSPFLDYYLDLRHHRDLELRIGQYKRPFARERITSSGELSLVDRSVVDSALQLDRDLGFDLRSRDFLGLGWLRYYLGVGTGEGRDGGLGADGGLLYFARVEVLPLGLFDDHTQADLTRSQTPRLSVGAAYAFHHRGSGVEGVASGSPADGGRTDSHHMAVDVLLLWAGWTLEADFLLRVGRRVAQPGGNDAESLDMLTPPSNGFGGFLQASYLLPTVDLELAVRAGMTAALGSSETTSFEPEGELGGGLGYYFEGHALSVHLDYFHLWDEQFLAGEDRIRAQIEVIF